jgi:crotonobetainyl-CoA:carnitine CoA-transferase CaiB-like acyl-CoA transferase
MTSAGPLEGIRVLDVSTIIAGPLACQILGDFGAEVIKVEHPTLGDGLRSHGHSKDGVPLWWKMMARNKRTIGLYLGDPDGAAILSDLAASADVLVENFRPGRLESWGLGYDRLSERNPGLVLARVTGWGQSGPYRDRPGFGTLAEAMSGFAEVTGEPDGPPTLPPFGLADSIAAMAVVSAVSMALYHRLASDGTGQVLDINILEPLLAALGPQPIWYDQLGYIQRRVGNRSVNNAPRNTYLTRDGRWVAISTSATSVAERVLRLVGRPDVVSEPWFQNGGGRAEHADELDEYVGEWIAQRNRDEVLEAFTAADAAVAPVYDTAELMDDEHIRATDMITEVTDEDFGSIRMQNVLFRMSATPGSIRWTGRDLGADTESILGDELGIEPGRIEELRKRGVIG